MINFLTSELISATATFHPHTPRLILPDVSLHQPIGMDFAKANTDGSLTDKSTDFPFLLLNYSMLLWYYWSWESFSLTSLNTMPLYYSFPTLYNCGYLFLHTKTLNFRVLSSGKWAPRSQPSPLCWWLVYTYFFLSSSSRY